MSIQWTKRHLIIGVRKTHRYVPDEKASGWLVPFPSSAAAPCACIVILSAITTSAHIVYVALNLG